MPKTLQNHVYFDKCIFYDKLFIMIMYLIVIILLHSKPHAMMHYLTCSSINEFNNILLSRGGNLFKILIILEYVFSVLFPVNVFP